MDNLTHSLVGLAAAKAGLERRTPYAVFVCVAAANLPDIDILALVKGPAFYLANHRGITHSLVGTFTLAVVFPLLFFACERLTARVRGREPRARLGGLLLCSLVLSASHPLLDWTNSYGVRPFLPWDGRWIYGDLLFVVDPWVWLMLGGACFLLTATTRVRAAAWGLLALVATTLFFRVSLPTDSSVPLFALGLWTICLFALFVMHLAGVGARVGPWAAAVAFALVLAYLGALSLLHARAREEAVRLSDDLAVRLSDDLNAPPAGRVLRVAATPVLADPTTWRCLADAESETFRYDLKLGDAFIEDLSNVAVVHKPAGADAEIVGRAARDADARVLLDFARFPVARVLPREGGGWVVRFADLRFTEPGGGRARPGGFALDVPVGAP
ncbi:MAG TPA: metal-dependent hydrolase [Pyrinomonadaceae bacterium]|nr:metal-dependent hydrolase [Pyrinomonadaceae bacterium]